MRSSYILSITSVLVQLTYGFSNLQPIRMPAGHQRQSPVSSKSPAANLNHRGGYLKASSPYQAESKCPFTSTVAIFGSVWGTGGVLYILAKAIKRVMPIAREPFVAGAVPLSQFQLGAYILTCLWFAYVEGYKGFQKKFSPLVVTRSFTLVPGKNGTRWFHYLLAPLYSMGLIHATRKRCIVSWSVTTGVAAIVAIVKRFPYPWRNIVDAGVVAGLTWGSLSILFLYIRAWISGKPPAIDAALPASVVADAEKKE